MDIIPLQRVQMASISAHLRQFGGDSEREQGQHTCKVRPCYYANMLAKTKYIPRAGHALTACSEERFSA